MKNLMALFGFRKQLQFIEDKNGSHQLGGDVPSHFKIPENQFWAGFQYLGYIDNTDRHFDWLPFPLHMIAPIFTNFDQLVLDYENPLEPKLIFPYDTSEVATEYDDLSKESYIVYNKANFSLSPFGGITEDNEFDIIGIAGKPHWQQRSIIPTCPKTKKKMRFVCQLTSNGPIKAREKNFSGRSDFYEEIFTDLNFWVDGDLYVFFEPSSKVACYFIQST